VAQTEQDVARLNELDNLLRTDDNSEYFITENDEGFRPWYSRLLTTLTLLTAEESVEYATATVEDTGATFVVVTDRNVITADVADLSDLAVRPAATVVPRVALTSLTVSATMRHDLKGSQLTGWPGGISIEAHYAGLKKPIVFAGNSYDRNTVDHVGAISKLLTLLRSDLPE
jgi:hypothetical protein